MDFRIIFIVNTMLLKKGISGSYTTVVKVDTASISHAIKIYHIDLYWMPDVGDSKLVTTIAVGGNFTSDESGKLLAQQQINDKLTEFFIENGLQRVSDAD